MDFRIKGGKFLANDKGARFEFSRYYPSGLRVTFWYTRTDGRDKVNSRTYYDKGIGVSASTGRPLYDLIHDERGSY